MRGIYVTCGGGEYSDQGSVVLYELYGQMDVQCVAQRSIHCAHCLDSTNHIRYAWLSHPPVCPLRACMRFSWCVLFKSHVNSFVCCVWWGLGLGGQTDTFAGPAKTGVYSPSVQLTEYEMAVRRTNIHTHICMPVCVHAHKRLTHMLACMPAVASHFRVVSRHVVLSVCVCVCVCVSTPVAIERLNSDEHLQKTLRSH